MRSCILITLMLALPAVAEPIELYCDGTMTWKPKKGESELVDALKMFTVSLDLEKQSLSLNGLPEPFDVNIIPITAITDASVTASDSSDSSDSKYRTAQSIRISRQTLRFLYQQERNEILGECYLYKPEI